MRFRTPHTGPHAGLLCSVSSDGALTPTRPVESAHVARAVCLPHVPDRDPQWEGIETEGEIIGPDTRGNRAKLVRAIVQHHGEGARNWAEEKASHAVQAWDRNVREGRTPRPKR